ncbi:MAG: serine hydrolase, partial [Candidatus Acidiferrum sp.]
FLILTFARVSSVILNERGGEYICVAILGAVDKFAGGTLLRIGRAFFVMLVMTAVCTPIWGQDAKFTGAQQPIEDLIRKSGADVAIAFRTLDGKTEWFFHADDPFHAASTMKIPVMIELFRQVREGKLKLDDALPIKNEFHSLADGSDYTLDAADDSEADLYKAVGQTRTLGQLCELMITVSSNFATNLLIEKLGVENIRATVRSLHADGMNVLRGVEDEKAFEKGLNNTTTARGLLQLLDAIAQGKAVDRESSRQMLEILERQQFNEGIPAGLPPGTRVAHKTGEITKIHHDAAIVFAPKPFVLVILVRGIADTKISAALIADITRLLYQATQ